MFFYYIYLIYMMVDIPKTVPQENMKDSIFGVKQENDLQLILQEKYHLELNGHQRFAPRYLEYFTKLQVWQHHTGFGGLDLNDTGLKNTFAVYSFALKPEEHQPSGTCNFSRIDNAILISENSASLNIYAINYNVLRIMSGMGGLAYSN